MVAKPTFVIAEAGVNHNGSEDLAVQLVDAAAAAGADAVKFQTFTAAKLVRKGAAKAAYQEAATGSGDQLEMLRELELSPATHARLAAHCRQRKILFMSTPFDTDAADMLLSLGMQRIKVPSGELTNHEFLRYLAGKNVPMILSTGMATLAEVQEAAAVVGSARAAAGLTAPLEHCLTLLHCTSNYPAAFRDVHLRAMRTIADSTGLPVGYSDHTPGIAVSLAAVAMGATIIEKHVTVDKALPGPDHRASLDPIEFRELVAGIHAIDEALGSPEKQPADSELAVRALVRRSWTAAVEIHRGESLRRDHLALLRPGDGIQPRDIEKALGRIAARDIPAGTTLHWADLT
jgi:N,N'-diacetyllegionaminate synthase